MASATRKLSPRTNPEILFGCEVPDVGEVQLTSGNSLHSAIGICEGEASCHPETELTRHVDRV